MTTHNSAPLQTDSPATVFAAVGGDAVLPCGSTAVRLSHVTTLEWERLDGPSQRVVHTVRDGQELELEKASEYSSRTHVMEDGSLRLRHVGRDDTGSYRCVVKGTPVETVVSLRVGEVSELELSVHRTSTNELFVLCESSVRDLPVSMFLRDASGQVLTGRSAGPESLRVVSVSGKVAAPEGNQMRNGTIICRVEVAKVGLVLEKKLRVTDDFSPATASDFSCYTVLSVVVVTVCIVTVAVVPLWMMEELRFSLIDYYSRKVRAWRYRPEREPLLHEYGDLSQITPSGASEMTARLNKLTINDALVVGVEASNILAEQDLRAISKYKDKIIQVGLKHNISPALIAAIISKQSLGGTVLQPSGYGQFDSNSYGLMQINKTFHAVTGGPFSLEHIDDGTKYLIHLMKNVRQAEEFSSWNSEQKLIGSLVAYISGPEKLREALQVPGDLDRVTPTGDFANDVIARARWFGRNGY
ncbi:uncharacterized protein PAE49_021368 isoform 2-T2 [Odontesthes bonariensis]|uniref:uncharacterized protein LOC142368947 isoform X2 n=1 Tax=Odontesthes bonariensis TaxID=219752 RepID=UPI003F587BF4